MYKLNEHADAALHLTRAASSNRTTSLKFACKDTLGILVLEVR